MKNARFVQCTDPAGNLGQRHPQAVVSRTWLSNSLWIAVQRMPRRLRAGLIAVELRRSWSSFSAVRARGDHPFASPTRLSAHTG